MGMVFLGPNSIGSVYGPSGFYDWSRVWEYVTVNVYEVRLNTIVGGQPNIGSPQTCKPQSCPKNLNTP